MHGNHRSDYLEPTPVQGDPARGTLWVAFRVSRRMSGNDLMDRRAARPTAVRSVPVEGGAKMPGPRSLAQLAGRLNDSPTVQRLAALRDNMAPVQLKVVQATRRKDDDPNKNKWYSEQYPDKYFDTKEEAQEYQDSQLEKHEKKRKAEQDAQRQERVKKYAKQLEKFKDDPALDSGLINLHNTSSKTPDVVRHVKVNQTNVKRYSEQIFAERRAAMFKTQVMMLGGRNFVLDPGTDIGLTPAIGKGKNVQREGKPKKNSAIANDLDVMVKRLSKANKTSITATRIRVGKDIDRMTRGNPPDDTHVYSGDELKTLQEIAGILRLDKGRVKNATTTIRESFTSGKYSFHQLLVEGKYPGALTGGVENLRQKAKEVGSDGELSEGSDLESEEEEEEEEEESSSGSDAEAEKSDVESPDEEEKDKAASGSDEEEEE
jgi:hypothetical protein